MSTQATLEPTFGGELIGPADPGYDEARRGFNGAIDRHPALIARCASADDVRLALAHARQHGLVVAVRGGGHSTPGFCTCDDGIVIDTGPMKSIEIDPQARTGRFGAGLTWAQLDAATQAHGLAVTGGRVSHTGVAGLTLGSGSGWLERLLGPTCASLLSAQVVTADGRIVRCSADESPELLWGLKGGGGNFGVVTELEFRLHPVGPMLFGGMVLHPRGVAKELARFYRDFMEQAPEEVGGALAFITAPPEDFVPEEARGRPATGLIVLHTGDPERGEEALRPLLEWGDPWLTMVQTIPYLALQQMIDGGNPWGICEYGRVDYLRELPDAAVDAFVDHANESRSPFTQLILVPLGGAMDRLDRGSMALEIPDAKWFYFCLAMWQDPAAAEHETAWARGFMDALRPWTVGKAPPNFIGGDESEARLRASYGDAKYERLVALKTEYDPENVFRLNQNIPPRAAV